MSNDEHEEEETYDAGRQREPKWEIEQEEPKWETERERRRSVSTAEGERGEQGES